MVAIQTELGTLAKGGAANVKTRILNTETVANGAIPKSLVDAAGDLLVGTADNTVGRLAKGAALTVLRVNAAGTALEWATATADHGGLSGLSDDDHPQYLNTSRHNALDHSAVIAAASATLIPPGTIWDYASAAIPVGWLACDGSAVSRSTYSALFMIIAETYGAGNGSTTFNLPDFRGRTSIGAGIGPGLTNRIVAHQYGEEKHALTLGELAAHSHAADPHSHYAQPHDHVATSSSDERTHRHPIALVTNLEGLWGATWGSLGSGSGVLNGGNYSGDDTHWHTITTSISLSGVVLDHTTVNIGSSGSSTPHENMQPSLAVYKMIKY